MANLTYLITGPTRGIGRTLFETLAARSDASTLIAAVRNPLDVNTQSLLELQKHSNCKIIIVKIDGECDGDAAVAIEELQKKNNIQHLDVSSGWHSVPGNFYLTPLHDPRLSWQTPVQLRKCTKIV